MLLTLSLFVNIALAQNTNSNNKEVKTEQKCSSTEKSNCAKKCNSAEKSANKECCSKKGTEKKCANAEKSTCAKKCANAEKSCSQSNKKQFVVKIKKQIQTNAQKEMLVVLKLVKNILIATKKIKGCCA